MKSSLRFRPLPPLAGEGWDGGACLKAFMLVAMATLSPWVALAAEPETPPTTEAAAPASEAEKTADDAAKPAEAPEADKGEEKSAADAIEMDKDDLYDEAARIVVQSGQASISYLQRRLRIGFSRAARLVDMMEMEGLVSAAAGGKPLPRGLQGPR